MTAGVLKGYQNTQKFKKKHHPPVQKNKQNKQQQQQTNNKNTAFCYFYLIYFVVAVVKRYEALKFSAVRLVQATNTLKFFCVFIYKSKFEALSLSLSLSLSLKNFVSVMKESLRVRYRSDYSNQVRVHVKFV